jgi:hypothetical protein
MLVRDLDLGNMYTDMLSSPRDILAEIKYEKIVF